MNEWMNVLHNASAVIIFVGLRLRTQNQPPTPTLWLKRKTPTPDSKSASDSDSDLKGRLRLRAKTRTPGDLDSGSDFTVVHTFACDDKQLLQLPSSTTVIKNHEDRTLPAYVNVRAELFSFHRFQRSQQCQRHGWHEQAQAYITPTITNSTPV